MATRRSWIIAALFGTAASTATVLASGGGGEGEVSLFGGDLGNALWTITIFVMVVLVLSKFAWQPILKGLQHREKFIHESLAQAKNDRLEAQRVLAEYAEKLNKAREEATVIVEEGRRDGEEVRKRIHAEARTEADAMIARAKREIGLARDDAVKQLYTQTVQLATNIAGKIVQKELRPADHAKLMDEALSEMKGMN